MSKPITVSNMRCFDAVMRIGQCQRRSGFDFTDQLAQHSNTPGQTFTILSVKNVKSGEDVAVSMAIAEGILDSSKQKYRNNVNGEIMSLDQAVKRSKSVVPPVYGSDCISVVA